MPWCNVLDSFNKSYGSNISRLMVLILLRISVYIKVLFFVKGVFFMNREITILFVVQHIINNLFNFKFSILFFVLGFSVAR